MDEKVKKFIEAYNRHVEWNREILNGGVNIDDFKDETRDIIKHYLDTNTITEKDYDLDNAKVYYYDDERPIKSELQALSLKSLCTHYFWCVEDMTEDEYKAERFRIVNEQLDEHKKEQMKVLKTAEEEIENINRLHNLLNDNWKRLRICITGKECKQNIARI